MASGLVMSLACGVCVPPTSVTTSLPCLGQMASPPPSGATASTNRAAVVPGWKNGGANVSAAPTSPMASPCTSTAMRCGGSGTLESDELPLASKAASAKQSVESAATSRGASNVAAVPAGAGTGPGSISACAAKVPAAMGQ